jgi:hypothetical protein
VLKVALNDYTLLLNWKTLHTWYKQLVECTTLPPVVGEDQDQVLSALVSISIKVHKLVILCKIKQITILEIILFWYACTSLVRIRTQAHVGKSTAWCLYTFIFCVSTHTYLPRTCIFYVLMFWHIQCNLSNLIHQGTS